MPTNQSSPWGGGALQACSDAESPPTCVGAHARTFKANKVPFSPTSLELSKRKDQAKSFPSKVAPTSFPSQTVALSGLCVWENGDEHKISTQSQFPAATDGSATLPNLTKGTRTSDRDLAAGLEQAANGLTETTSMTPFRDVELQRCMSLQTSQAADDAALGLEPLGSNGHGDVFNKGKASLQQNKSVMQTADCSPQRSVPPKCLTLHVHQGATLGKDAPSFCSAEARRGSATARRCHSAKTSQKFGPTQSHCSAITSDLNQLMVTGGPPAVLTATSNRKLQRSPNENRATPSRCRPRSTVCRQVSAPARASSKHCVVSTAEQRQEVIPGSLVSCVTSQISAIHLTTSSSPNSSPSPSDESLVGESQLPGAQVDGGEEELPDELENANSDDASDDSDCTSINGSSSKGSLHSSIEEPMSVGAEGDREERPALVPSLFPFVPPTLYFSTANEKVELLPAEQRRLLKWKMSTVTPNVVKHTIGRSHFKVTKKSHDWLGCWGHHMKSLCFKAIGEHQKLNHFPGTFQIGRKDRLWRNLSKMQVRFGKREFNFFPRTFVLPQDIKLLRKAWEDGGSRQKWIIKPPASARGIGIQVIHKWSQMPRKRPLLVQKYLHKPYLISGNKFDLRIYVYVTSYDPLRIYIFTDGLVRFASCKYSSSMKTLSNKFIHLTNYSVNKKNSEYQTNSDDKACQGHKWALKALWQYLSSRGINTSLIWEKIKDIVIKTIIASEPYVNSLLKMHVRSPYSCHELFGFDIMLDENLKPWILEVNISPSLHSNTALDVSIKGQMIRDVLNLAGFHIPLKDEVLAPCSSTSSSTSSLSRGKRERSKPDLSPDEKVKRACYLTQRYAEQDFLGTVLDVLTPDDVRVLAESEDELNRRGDFERIFPSSTSSRYLRFFECPRYLNILLDQWEQKYWNNRTKGISLLWCLCQEGIHLGTSDPAHIWSKCSYVCRSEPPQQDISSPSRSRVVVSHQCWSPHDDDHDSDKEVASVSSLPVSPSPGSSVASSACSSPQPSLTQSSLS